MNVLALCAGIGGLELGLHLAEPRANPVVFVEQNEFCRSVLAARWPGVPIWDDVTTFDGRTWAGRIDVITGGFPCQPWSVAGKRLPSPIRLNSRFVEWLMGFPHGWSFPDEPVSPHWETLTRQLLAQLRGLT